ncbi:hypothetical protein ASE63_05880 [Bosea sp. Root381]|uniref:ATP-grasp domain-containing protein n=1 Tax=Bosea sp. Root381 TaxID=1736524 RepID=UPI0006FA1822|nr:ATP-grasp domain-containing protein [Bosea sp. Root381]KRE05848.1 hypothetical protein ASE63_05880 [Bosea sp. Root381]
MSKALILANGFRLQYRALRCAAPLFDAVHVYGTADAKSLSQSAFCRRFHARRSTDEPFATPADVEAIGRILSEEGIDYILPSDADTTRFLAEHRGSLPATCYPVPTPEAFDSLNDKSRFARFCARLDLPHPTTMLCQDIGEIRAALKAAGPGRDFVVKPIGLWGSLGVARISHATAEPLLKSLGYAPILLQDYIPGTEFTTIALARGGDLEKVVHCRREEQDIGFFDQAEATSLAAKIAASLGYDGVMVFDIRVDPAGRLHLIECNPCFWYRMEMAMLAGANFVEFGFWPERSRSRGLFPVHPGRLSGAAAVLQRALQPWKLTASDRASMRFILSDPVPAAITLAGRLGRMRQAANGRQL